MKRFNQLRETSQHKQATDRVLEAEVLLQALQRAQWEHNLPEAARIQARLDKLEGK